MGLTPESTRTWVYSWQGTWNMAKERKKVKRKAEAEK
jgi:hypothetical protein